MMSIIWFSKFRKSAFRSENSEALYFKPDSRLKTPFQNPDSNESLTQNNSDYNCVDK